MSEIDSIVLNGTEYMLAGGGGSYTTYTITNNLTNVTTSNSATTIREGRAYSATLAVVASGELDSVTITMGGIDITSSAWNVSNRSINISNVTGDIIITATASVVMTVPLTNWDSWQTATKFVHSNFIDATDNDLYLTIPFVEGAEGMVEGTTADSVAYKMMGLLYNSDESTDDSAIVGYYYNGQVNTTWSSTLVPTMNFETKTLVAAKGYYVRICLYKQSSFSSNNNALKYAQDYILSAVLESGESGEELTNAQRTDMDLLQNYTLKAVSLNTDTESDSSTYNGVLEEAKNAWMTEYGGSINKIPLICHADQHSYMTEARSKDMWDKIDDIVSWFDISKVINFGDTTNAHDNPTNPFLPDASLEQYLKATVNVPFSKRIEIWGNHDCFKTGNSDGWTPQEPAYLNPYFKNVMARRTSNNNYHVTYDPYFNVKYVVYSNYDYADASHYFIVSSEQYDFLIDEMSKNDGYDIIILGHQDAEVYEEHIGTLVKARYDKTSGSFTDKEGRTHSYDFTGCENELLVCLHGHSHSDGYNYTQTVLSQCFANYYDSTNPIYFVIVDRANRQIKIWKVTNTPEYTLTTRPLIEST